MLRDQFESQLASLESLPGPAGNWAFVGRQQAGLDLAHRLGLLTVAFNYDPDAVADVYIEQFNQLAQHLKRQGSPEIGSQPAKAA
jgi:alkanesulfonate monooxygenase SsuD/methylene tetrahydromethanopterin reductase-like flavin-dependent oxidoreductase (luciferase family)